MLTLYGASKYSQMGYGGGNPSIKGFVPGIRIACIGDLSSHGGVIVSTGGNATVFAKGTLVAVNGALHSCPIPLHETTPITAVVKITYVDGVKVITYGAVAGCGAIILPPLRMITVENDAIFS